MEEKKEKAIKKIILDAQKRALDNLTTVKTTIYMDELKKAGISYDEFVEKLENDESVFEFEGRESDLWLDIEFYICDCVQAIKKEN